MLNQLNTIDTNLRTRLNLARTLRRNEGQDKKPETRPAEGVAHIASSPSALPPESVYFIIELA